MKLEDVVVGEKYEVVGKDFGHNFKIGETVVVRDLEMLAENDKGARWCVSPDEIEPIDIYDKLKQIRRDVLNDHENLDNPFLEGLRKAYELGKESK